MNEIDFKNLDTFSEFMREISYEIGFKISARGWGYILEQKRFINKNDFDKVASTINKCRKKGLLPIDFTEEESSRLFQGVEEPDSGDVIDLCGDYLRGALNAGNYFTPDWWEGEKYYIQMVVEKVDLVTLFAPVCKQYHIPIANSKGWSSILQRATYARRFKEAEERGQTPVLLYCGDHDPDGLRISEFLRKNLSDLKDIEWDDGVDGYDPSDLIIDRFGLNFDFIEENNFSWIDNLITGSNRNLASPSHKNYKMDYVQEYLRTVGERKCEANAIVTLPSVAKDLVREAIEKYLGKDATDVFHRKRISIQKELKEYLDEAGARTLIKKVITDINDR